MKMPRIRVAGILEKENKLLFVKHKKNEREYYLLPGGGVDYGESFETALKREFLEEVNININVKNMLFISEAIAPDSSKHIVNVFFSVEYVSGELKLAQEEILAGVEYISIDKIEEYTIFPNIKKELVESSKSKEKHIKYIGNIWED
jgi:ADP-ribose pyrophosphatase YjhB (NUDIX family)